MPDASTGRNRRIVGRLGPEGDNRSARDHRLCATFRALRGEPTKLRSGRASGDVAGRLEAEEIQEGAGVDEADAFVLAGRQEVGIARHHERGAAFDGRS